VELLLTSEHLAAEVTAYITHNECKLRTSMFSAGFKPTITDIKRLQTEASDLTAIGIGVL
jgi:hypothetical protein